MSEITKITDHLSEATKRLLAQYKDPDKIVNLQKMLKVYAPQWDELETVFFELRENRALTTSVGAQLDEIGLIVGENRDGRNDADYLIGITIRIGVNVSEGEPERVIAVFALLIQENLVRYINQGRRGIQMTMFATIADQDAVNAIFRAMQQVIAAGVRLNMIICADPSIAFAMAGNDPNGLGFDDTTGTTGGLLSTEYRFLEEFAMDGDDPDPEGFGAGSDDPLVGGGFIPV